MFVRIEPLRDSDPGLIAATEFARVAPLLCELTPILVHGRSVVHLVRGKALAAEVMDEDVVTDVNFVARRPHAHAKIVILEVAYAKTGIRSEERRVGKV